MAYEVETFNFIVEEVKRVTGVVSVVKGYPSWNRIALAPPVAAVEIGGLDPATTGNRIGGLRLGQQWNVMLFGSNEPEKVQLVSAFKDWIKNTVLFTVQDGPRITLRLLSGEPHRPLTDAQAEQYGYVFILES